MVVFELLVIGQAVAKLIVYCSTAVHSSRQLLAFQFNLSIVSVCRQADRYSTINNQ